MSFAAPSGPPPPSVPEGWKAQFNDRYNQWFFVNLRSGESQWEPPRATIHHHGPTAPPSGPPPSYKESNSSRSSHSTPTPAAEDKKSHLHSNNPYKPSEGDSTAHRGGPNQNVDDDARLAERLQEEENTRAAGRYQSGPGGASADYYNQSQPSQPSQPQYSPAQSQLPPDDQQRGKGLLGKLLGRSSGKQSGSYGGYPPAQGGYPPQGGYGGYPPQGYSGYPPGGYPPGAYPPGAYPPQGYGYPPPQGGYYAQQEPKKSGIGAIGGAALGGAALGIGGGLLVGDIMENEYNQGFEDGALGGDGFDDGGF